MSATDDVLVGWERASFTAAGYTRDTYRRGVGPAVIVIHEVPGITPKVTEFAPRDPNIGKRPIANCGAPHCSVTFSIVG